jgi:hypothetical protein
MIDAPGFRKVVTSLYPEGDEFLSSDAVFGVKKSLVVVSVWLVVVRRTGSGPFYYYHSFLRTDSFAGRNSLK